MESLIFGSLRTDFWNFSRKRCAACFCSLWPARIVSKAVRTGAKACSDAFTFVAMTSKWMEGQIEGEIGFIARNTHASVPDSLYADGSRLYSDFIGEGIQ